MRMIDVITHKRVLPVIIITVVYIFIAGFLPRDFQVGPEQPLFHVFGDLIPVSWWRISHLLLHMWFGYWFPYDFWVFFILGIMWEVTEWLLGKIHNQKYWYGTVEDIFMNVIGFNLGAAIKLHA